MFDPFMMPPAIRSPEPEEPVEGNESCELCNSYVDVEYSHGLMACGDCRVDIERGYILVEGVDVE